MEQEISDLEAQLVKLDEQVSEADDRASRALQQFENESYETQAAEHGVADLSIRRDQVRDSLAAARSHVEELRR